MQNSYLYSLILELVATSSVAIPTGRGDQTHALFLHLVEQIDPDLSRRLHESSSYRPFTVSRLSSSERERKPLTMLRIGQTYRLRVTLLDGGPLWQRLSSHFLETEALLLHLDKASFQLARVLSSPASGAEGWAKYTDWQTLASTAACTSLTLDFASPCAFSLGNRQFALFPEPKYVWDSLLRTWNQYAPPVLQIEKQALREFVAQQVTVSDYRLETSNVAYTDVIQKGFQGTCTYQIKESQPYASQVATLAAFALYAG
ncbi:MAG: CRISPR system precrRNA processing endoribonuclease RAMP protein Cas6, partial [Ktedonobacteraceae bacterium]